MDEASPVLLHQPAQGLSPFRITCPGASPKNLKGKKNFTPNPFADFMGLFLNLHRCPEQLGMDYPYYISVCAQLLSHIQLL